MISLFTFITMMALVVLSSFAHGESGEMAARNLAVAAPGYGQVGQTLFGVRDSLNTTTTSNVEYGYNVALSANGERLAVSSYRHDWLTADDSGAVNEDGGAVFIYDYDGLAWVYKTHFVGVEFEEMGRWPISLSADGQTIAIRRGTGTRDAQVYSVDSSGTKTKLGSDITCAEHGSMLALTETSSGVMRIAVSCEFYGSGNSGIVKVLDYNTTSGDWQEVGGSPLSVDPTGATDGLFGFDLAWALDGTRLAASAPNYGGTLFEQGLVRVYDFDGTATWTQLGSDITGSQVNEKLGFTMSISHDGSTLVIGSPNKDIGGNNNTGAVGIYTFNATSASFDFQQEIIGAQPGDVFGRGISVSTDGFLFSASSSSHSEDRGQVQVFELSGGTWLSIAQFEGDSPSDLLGFNNLGVAMTPNGERIAMGAINAQTNGIVQVFDSTFTSMPSLAPSLAPSSFPTDEPIIITEDGQLDTTFMWDIEFFPEQTEIGFSEEVDTSEIILHYNISLRDTTIAAFESDCITPIPSNVTSLSSAVVPTGVMSGNFSIYVDIQQENVLESNVWTDIGLGEGLISLCIRLDLTLPSPSTTSVTFHETKLDVSVNLFQNFNITDIDLDRLNATETDEDANVDYSLTAFQCNSDGIEIDDTLTQGSDVYICVETFATNVQIVGVRELMITQDGNDPFYTTPIVDGETDFLTETWTTKGGKMAMVRYQIVSQFFDEPIKPVSAVGTVLMMFADDGGTRRLRTAKVLSTPSRRELQDDPLQKVFNVTMQVDSDVDEDSSAGRVGGVASLIFIMIASGVLAL